MECLEGRKATSYPAMEEELKSADYQTEKVVVDGKIITSRGMGTAIDFAAKLSRTHQRNKREGRITGKYRIRGIDHLWTNQRKSAGLSSLRSPA